MRITTKKKGQQLHVNLVVKMASKLSRRIYIEVTSPITYISLSLGQIRNPCYGNVAFHQCFVMFYGVKKLGLHFRTKH